jgi:hypothetical protein
LNISILDDFIKKTPVVMSTEAVTDPVAILDKFRPTIADAGILNKLAPEPEYDPLDKNRDPVIVALPMRLKDPEILAEPV